MRPSRSIPSPLSIPSGLELGNEACLLELRDSAQDLPDQDSGRQFIRALAEDFAKHGPAVIEKVRTDKPADYLKIVASLLPKDINLSVRPLDELSDDQLLARLAQLTEMAKPLLAKLETDRDEAEPEASRH